MEQVIHLSNATKEFRASRNKTVRALAGVSFDVRRGEIFSLLGPNGAGKTTLIKLLLGIVRPTDGEGTLLGRPLGDVHAKSRIGYLPENHRYPNYLTGEQVLRYFGQLTGMHGAALEKRINDVLAIVNMAEWRATKIRKYSKGMLQRIGLAQAMLNEPDVIFLDEPTDGVDPIGRKEIRQTLVHLKDAGATIFLNSHLLSEVELISDRVAILNKGTLASIGTVDALTRTASEVTIDVAGDVGPAVTALNGVAEPVNIEGTRIVLHVENLVTLNAAIDALRASGVEIREIINKRASLEEAFMSLIEKVSE